MGLSGIKSITTLSGSGFYRKIMQKYQTGRKNIFRFPTLIFFKEKRSVSPQKIEMILKFSLQLNQQNILPVLILKNIPIGERLPRLKTEKKALQSILKLKNLQSTNNVTKIFLTSLKIPQGYRVASEHYRVVSEHFLTENISTNKTLVFSFLKSLIFRSGNIVTNSNKILKSPFLYVSNAFYQQKTCTISPDILTLNPKILNYENNMEILNSQIFGKKICYRLLNIVRNPTFIDKENTLRYWSVFEDKSSSNYLGKQNLIPYLIMKNIPVIKEMFSWLNTEKKGMQSLVKPKDVQNISDVANISQATFKIPRMYQIASGILPTGHISTTKISVFSFLKSLIFKAGNIVTNSNKIWKSSFLPVSNAFYQQKTRAISPDILTLNPKILNYENNMEILNSQIFGKKICYRLLNIARNPTFIYKENTLRYWPVFKDKLPSNYLEKQNLIPSLIMKNILVIKEIFSWLNAEKNGMQLLVKPEDARNINDVANISQATFKIPRMYQIASGILPTGHISTNKISIFSFLKSLIFKTGNTVTISNKILKPLPLSKNAVYYRQAINSIYPRNAQVISQILNYKNNVKFLNSQVFRVTKNYESLNITRHSAFINKKSILKNQPLFEDKLPAVLLQDNLLFNKIYGVNKRFFEKSNWITVNKPLIKNYYDNFEHETPSYAQSKRKYKIRYESLVFQDQDHIEQEIEQIKRTVIETKKSVSEKTVPVFGEADIKKYLDINRISSQVYQNIERTIRMERERRGV